MKWFITLIVLAMVTNPAVAQTDTTFTYQGSLDEQGVPANGVFNLDFSLFDALSGGNQIGSEVMFNDHLVVDGLFTLQLDFGATAFDNTSRWIEVSVNGSELSPRQPVTRSPYAIQTRGIFVDDDGKVGIGTSTPFNRLHVKTDGGQSIYAENTASTGNSYGGYFKSQSTEGTGVFGQATATTGTTYGVYGNSQGSSGRGVYGRAASGSGTTYGGYFESFSTSGRGVYGEALANSGITYGGQFESKSPTGRGVYGEANASSGVNYGGNFRSFSTSGRGLYGEAVANSGTNYGVYGRSNSPNGFDFYAAGVGSNYGAESSIRWKSNVRNIDNPLQKIARLRGVYYDWDADHGGQHDLGMIAEEVGKVLPEIVNYEENGIDAIGMDYSKMTPLLVEAVNALRTEKDNQLASLRNEKNDEISELREAHAAEINDLRDQLSDLQQIVERLASNHDKENR